jgi:hypothetical protein
MVKISSTGVSGGGWLAYGWLTGLSAENRTAVAI